MELLLIPLITGGVMVVYTTVREAINHRQSKELVVVDPNQPKRPLWFTKDAKFEKEQARKQAVTSENYRKLQKAEYDHHKTVVDVRKERAHEFSLFDKQMTEAEEPIFERKATKLCSEFDAFMDMEFPDDPQEFLAVLEEADKRYATLRNTIEASFNGKVRKDATQYAIDTWSYFHPRYMTAPAASKIHDLAARRYTEVHPLWVSPYKTGIEPETFVQKNASGTVVHEFTTDRPRSEETFKIDLQGGKIAYGINKNIIDFEWSELFTPMSKAERDKLFTPTAAEVLNLLEDYHKAIALGSRKDFYRALNRFFAVDTCEAFSDERLTEFVEQRKELFDQDPTSVEKMRVEMEKRLDKAKDKKLLVRIWEGDVTAEDFYDKRSTYNRMDIGGYTGSYGHYGVDYSQSDLISAGGWAKPVAPDPYEYSSYYNYWETSKHRS